MRNVQIVFQTVYCRKAVYILHTTFFQCCWVSDSKLCWETVTLWKLFILDEQHSQMAGGRKVFSKAKPLNVCASQRWFCSASAAQYCMLGSFWSVDLAVFVCPMLWCWWLAKTDEWIIKRHVRSVFSEGHIYSSAEILIIHFSLFAA